MIKLSFKISFEICTRILNKKRDRGRKTSTSFQSQLNTFNVCAILLRFPTSVCGNRQPSPLAPKGLPCPPHAFFPSPRSSLKNTHTVIGYRSPTWFITIMTLSVKLMFVNTVTLTLTVHKRGLLRNFTKVGESQKSYKVVFVFVSLGVQVT